jgi:hypothetical protein
MREILFRAKRLDGGGWVEGDYIASDFLSPHKVETTIYFNDAYGGYQWQYFDVSSIEVVGNIHDTPPQQTSD